MDDMTGRTAPKPKKRPNRFVRFLAFLVTLALMVGAVVLVAMVMIWRKMEGKTPIHLSLKTIGKALLGIVGALLLGVGMCMSMVWSNMVLGIVLGLFGIIALLCLIPLTRGLK